MALIGEIRKNSWLLIVLIGLGLAGFIVMDMFSGQQSAFGGQETRLAEVEGKDIEFNEFSRYENVLYGNSGGEIFSRRNTLYNYFVEKAIVENEADDLGLGVGKEELIDLQFGNNLSPVISQRFRNPNTGQVDRNQLSQFKTRIDNGTLAQDQQLGPFWQVQEQEIIKDRLQSKLNSLVTKAVYTPTWMVEMEQADQSKIADFAYVQVPFTEITDEEVSVSDDDLQKYLDANKARFVSDVPTRKLEYVVFNVEPTALDTATLLKEMLETAAEFRTTDNDTSFVEINYGSFDGVYSTKDQVSPTIADTVFSIPVGTVYGPYREGKSYSIVKVRDRKLIPNSVRVRHILRSAQDPNAYIAAQNTIDSLKNLIQNGTHSFDSLARAFSQGPTSVKGGDLGVTAPGRMVKPFNDLIFFQAEPNKVYSVVTQFGVHLVEVTEQFYTTNKTGVQLAYVSQNINPSEETQQAKFAQVSEFVSKHRTLEALAEAAAADPSIQIQASQPIQKNDFAIGQLAPGNSSRDIIKWAFGDDAEMGRISPQVYAFQDPVDLYESQYVIAGLKSEQSPGVITIDDVREQIEPIVLNEKKAAALKGKISSTDLAAIAAEFAGEVDTARNVTMNSPFLPGLGSEPKLVAAALGMGVGQSSQVIEGNNGVYVISVTRSDELPNGGNIPQIRQQMEVRRQNQIAGQLMRNLRESAEIMDNRSQFY